MQRLVFAAAYSLLAFVLLLAIQWITICGLIGPWGGALDMPNETSFPATSNLLVILLWCVTLGGSILIGWRWSGPARSTVAKTQESRTSDSSRV